MYLRVLTRVCLMCACVRLCISFYFDFNVVSLISVHCVFLKIILRIIPHYVFVRFAYLVIVSACVVRACASVCIRELSHTHTRTHLYKQHTQQNKNLINVLPF